MTASKPRAHFQRLLAGAFRPDDLMNLFIFARDHNDGRETVKEIGNFAAHHDKRHRGLVTLTTRDWFATVQFHAPRWLSRNPSALNISDLPSVTPDYLRASLRRMDHETLVAATGIRLAEARRMLPFILRTLVRLPNGKYALGRLYTQKEQKLLKCLFSTVVIRAAFDGATLYSDFSAVLLSNGLASKAELASVPRLSALVQLFAISLMHRCVIVLNDDSSDVLCAAYGKSLEVNSAVRLDPNKTIYLSSSMFHTALVPSEHCTDRLLKERDWKDFDIELNPRGKLDILI